MEEHGKSRFIIIICIRSKQKKAHRMLGLVASLTITDCFQTRRFGPLCQAIELDGCRYEERSGGFKTKVSSVGRWRCP